MWGQPPSAVRSSIARQFRAFPLCENRAGCGSFGRLAPPVGTGSSAPNSAPQDDKGMRSLLWGPALVIFHVLTQRAQRAFFCAHSQFQFLVEAHDAGLIVDSEGCELGSSGFSKLGESVLHSRFEIGIRGTLLGCHSGMRCEIRGKANGFLAFSPERRFQIGF